MFLSYAAATAKAVCRKEEPRSINIFLINMLEEHLISQGEKKTKPGSKDGEHPIKKI